VELGPNRPRNARSVLSVFNLLGRFAWASLSDWIGRKAFFANLAVSPVSDKHTEQRKPRDRMSKPVHV
jgi:hypothetical protein